MRRSLLCPLLAVAMLLPSCKGGVDVQSGEGKEAPGKSVAGSLSDSLPGSNVDIAVSDSLSYSVGVVFSTGMHAMMQEHGFGGTLAGSFAKGLRDAFPADASGSTIAYTGGVKLAARIADIIECNSSVMGVRTADIDRASLRSALTDGKTVGGPSADDVISARQILETGGNDVAVAHALGVILLQKSPDCLDGVTKENHGDFVRGVCDAFPMGKSAESDAYLAGVGAAAEAEMLLNENRGLFRAVPGVRVSRRAYIDAVVASALGKNGENELRVAKEYYDRMIYRMPAERFLAYNRTRYGVTELPSGLQYKVQTLGDGAVAGKDGYARCMYKCTLTDGYIIETTGGKAEQLKVDAQLPGLKEALMTLPAGTECMLYVPWSLAYGTDGVDKTCGKVVVPPYSILVYDLKILGK